MDLFEVSSVLYPQTYSRLEVLRDILGCRDDHYSHYDLVVHGITPSEVSAMFDGEGLQITETTLDGFVPAQLPEIRDRLIGRL